MQEIEWASKTVLGKVVVGNPCVHVDTLSRQSLHSSWEVAFAQDSHLK